MKHFQSEEIQKPQTRVMKKCPFCSEEIQADAIKCRFCQTMLVAQQPIEIELTSKKYKRAMYYGHALQGLGIMIVIASIWISFYLSSFWQSLMITTAILGAFMFIFGYSWKKWGEQMAWWNNG